MATKQLAGIIIASSQPERLAVFYREVLGIPFAQVQHGQIREHLECLFGDIHFAIIKKGQIHAGSNITPSFRVDNLQRFIEQLKPHNIKPLHPIIELGEGKYCSTIPDPDGNAIRLVQLD
jgi:predicted enzyme related to lactoylglutathione lyase